MQDAEMQDNLQNQGQLASLTRHSDTTPFCGYGATRVLNWRAFIIRLIPGSPPPPACRLESLGTRLHITKHTKNLAKLCSAHLKILTAPIRFSVRMFM